MKRAKPRSDELRAEYKRSEFKQLERGRYHARVKASSSAVALDPDVATGFPNSEAVNKALYSLLEVAQAITSTSGQR